jgi:hypothetical protein
MNRTVTLMKQEGNPGKGGLLGARVNVGRRHPHAPSQVSQPFNTIQTYTLPCDLPAEIGSLWLSYTRGSYSII